jgi:hypothetical protein
MNLSCIWSLECSKGVQPDTGQLSFGTRMPGCTATIALKGYLKSGRPRQGEDLQRLRPGPRRSRPSRAVLQGLVQPGLTELCCSRTGSPGPIMDADLYSSTSYVLHHLRPYIRPGTLIYFDEMNHVEHEPKAFDEFMKGTSLTFRPVCADRTPTYAFSSVWGRWQGTPRWLQSCFG